MRVYQTVLEMIRQKQPGVLITIVNATPAWNKFVGQHLVWFPTGNMVWDSLEPVLQEKLHELCQQVLRKREFQRTRLEWGEEWLDLMMEAILPASRLVILGCGHVGQAVAKVAAMIGWELAVVDDRPTFANPGLFPAGVKVICDDFSRAIDAVQPGANDYFVIVTRGHQYDRLVLESLAGRKMAYVGLIGSKRRVRGLFDELMKEGVSKEWLDSLYSPIGLSIGAETPEEIAVSIMAEIIQVLRKGAAK